MQSVFNSVKGTALGVAEYLTPVLKVILIFFNFFVRGVTLLLIIYLDIIMMSICSSVNIIIFK